MCEASNDKIMNKIIIPVAGLGSRLKPLTDNVPKNLLPLNGRPMLDYTVREAAEAGLEQVVLIISPIHRPDFENYIFQAKESFPGMEFFIREQPEPLGHGDAILKAEDLIGSDPFVVRFPDDLYLGKPSVVSQLKELFQKLGCPMVLLSTVPWEDVSRWGVVSCEPTGEERGRLCRLSGIVEKPKKEDAPSNKIISAGYILDERVMNALREISRQAEVHKKDSVLVGDGLAKVISEGYTVYGFEIGNERLDCGTLEGYISAKKKLDVLSGCFPDKEI